MRIAVLALGSRGDVQPLIALAVSLAKRGHDVRLVTHDNFAEIAAGRGVAFEAVTGDLRVVLSGADGKRMTASGRNRLTALAAMRAIARQARDWWIQLRDLSAGAEMLVSSATTFAIAASLAECRDVAWVRTNITPVAPTADFPSPLLPAPPLPMPGWANRLHHHLDTQICWQAFRRSTNGFRREIFGLPPWPRFGPFARFRAERRPLLMACSPHVIARPRDWPAEVEVTGYWFLDRPPEWVPPPDLMRFLRADPPPVYIGFGSMTMADPAATAALVTEAVAKAGCRAVIGAGWGGLRPRQQHDNIYSTEELPHDWLFPQMAAVVHHCGAGTTASALRAGLPSVPVPFMADQFFWAWRLRRLGVATAAVPHRKLSVQALVTALRNAIDDDEMRQRARSLGAAIRAEDGLLRAVAAVEKHASQLTQRVGRLQQTLA
jgi:sterol 3beta-glucosyltransferase